MNIVYAVSGEGRGHSSLAKAILPVLESAGHRVKVMTYGMSLPRLRQYDLIEIRGIRHGYDRAGRLSLAKSLAENAGIFGYYWSNWKSLRRQLMDFSPDLFIVNFEPLSPFLARSLGVPVVSFDNQHSLLFGQHRVPRGFRQSYLLTQTAARVVAAGADAYVVVSFAPFVGRNPRVSFVPPVVQAEFRPLHPRTGDYVFVYLKERNPRFLDVLRRTDERFVVYGYDQDLVEGNLNFRSYNDEMPLELAGAKAVMATAGLSLIAECLWLKKPFFAVPLKNEYEQTSNALWIKESGFGDFAETPSREKVDDFLARLGDYRKAVEGFQFDPDAAGRTLLGLAASLGARPRRQAA